MIKFSFQQGVFEIDEMCHFVEQTQILRGRAWSLELSERSIVQMNKHTKRSTTHDRLYYSRGSTYTTYHDNLYYGNP